MAIGELTGRGELTGNISASGEILGTLIAQKGARGVGISSIEKTGTSGLVDTYTITYTDHSTDTIEVTNGAKGDTGETGATGNGISSITKTGTSGLVDTYTITYTNGETTTFDVNNGEDGVDGISPTITTNKVGKETTLTITDATGTTTASIIDGDDGEDGVSPTITSTKSGKTTTLTITDAGGTSTATILDGEDGAIHYTAGDNITIDANNVISASGGANVIYITGNETQAEKNAIGQTIYDAYKNGEYYEVVILNVIDKMPVAAHLSEQYVTNGSGYISFAGITNSTGTGSTYYGVNYKMAYNAKLFIFVTDDVVTNCYTINGIHGYVPQSSSSILGMNNTTAWTPQNNYQPATKKYVDDAVAGAGGGGSVIEVELVEGSSGNNPFIFSGKKTGLYNLKGDGLIKYFKGTSESTMPHAISCNYLYIVADYDEASNDDIIAYADYIYRDDDTLKQYLAPILKDTTDTRGTKLGTISYSNMASGLITTDNAQTITGVKTFSALPESSVAPTTDNQLANKKYVDDSVSGFSNKEMVIEPSRYAYASDPFIFEGKGIGFYLMAGGSSTSRYFKGTSTAGYTLNVDANCVYVIKDYTTAAEEETIAYAEVIKVESTTKINRILTPLRKDSTANPKVVAGTALTSPVISNLVAVGNTQTITGKKTFSTLPESSVTPTTNNQLTNKKYVDDSVAAVVESGSNANGDYVKFADGTMICYKTITGTVDLTSSTMDGHLYTGSISLGDSPATFTSRPSILVTANGTSGTQFLLIGSSSGSTGSASSFGHQGIARFASRTGVAYILDVMAIGKWK